MAARRRFSSAIRNAGLVVGSCVSVLVLGEVILRLFLPIRPPATIGYPVAPSAALYGWGFNPGQLIVVSDPDTGQIYKSPANPQGWRDQPRSVRNRALSYRILVLGDSVTFGAIVPADKIYSRQLEDKLLDLGYNAEVVNMSYGGWGTDQELEALRNEGLAYRPQLVVLQFCTNDLTDNLYRAGRLQRAKPFRYRIDESGQLVRELNPSFHPPGSRPRLDFTGQLLEFIRTSEVAKRLYWLRISEEYRDRGAHAPSYGITPKRIDHISAILKLREDDGLVGYLRSSLGSAPSRQDIATAVEQHGHGRDLEVVLRLLEDRWFQDDWSRDPDPPKYLNDPTSAEWTLYFRLVQEAAQFVRANGGQLALLSENDDAGYEWETYWFRLDASPPARERYLIPTGILQDFARRLGIGFIPHRRRYQRARNDPHPNVAGNTAMAEDVFDYLIAQHERELSSYRKPQ
jgi:lysophospholipase L1-like esterase